MGDRVELTAAEREELIEALQMPTMWRDKGLPTENVLYQTNDGGLAEELVDDRLLPVISRILADRVQALTAERDELATAHEFVSKQFATMQREKEHGWREAEKWEAKAESVAAELAAANARCAELEGEYKSLEVGYNAQVQHGRNHCVRAEALQATLDRVTALADEWHERAYSGESIVDGMFNECEVELRAALTPEGTK